MTNGATIRTSVGQALTAVALLLLGYDQAAGAQMCNFVLNKQKVQPRDVLLFRNNRPVVVSDAMTAKSGREVTLGYIIPGREYVSGALLVKFRYQQAGGAPSTSSSIRLFRNSYVSPCTNKTLGQYDVSSTNDVYVDYHRYGFRDPEEIAPRNLDSFHADVGVRPNTGCLKTNDDAIRGQFLFETRVEDRRVARGIAVLERQYQKLWAPTTAQADPLDFNQFTEYHTTIIPYRKAANKSACVTFTIPPLANVLSTEVMIVDADDALVPDIFDPQKRRKINWQ
jgi:hypothetical protein